jgi:NAD(P)-dependent dehydrogenase (short-subunit alcohol dehydrogenase family)
VADKRTVLTTGANSGIGLAVTLDLAAHGFRSVGTVRSEAKAEVVTKAAAAAGVTVETVLLDINDAAACEEVIERVRPDALVNNAGFLVYAPVELVNDEEVQALFETLVFSPMRLARLSLPHMREQGWGRIVNISSLVGRVTMPMLGWYSAAKHALEAVSDALRVEVASCGVAVVLVEPGTVGTNIFGEFETDEDRFRGRGYDTAYDRFRVQLNLSKLMAITPDRAARSIRRTLQVRSPRARYLLGADANLVARSASLMPTRVRDMASRLGYGF